MKNYNILFMVFGLLLLTACKTEVNCPDNPLAKKNQVVFNSTIGEMSTRASGTTWDQGDAIGIYALNPGQALSDQAIYESKANIKFTTPGDGNFTAATTTIDFPNQGNLDFISYYPFQTTIENYTYKIDVTDQTNPAAIDLLYSNNAKGANKNTTPVSLVFNHKLTLLIFEISVGDGVTSLDGLIAKVENMLVDGTMSLADGVVTSGSTKAAISPKVNITNSTAATVTAIVMPGQDLTDAKISFTLNGNIYEWTPDAQALASGKKYSYKLKLSTTGIVSLQPKATITDWEDGFTGTSDIILTPNTDPKFEADKTTISIAASGTLSDIVKLTTQDDQAWSVASNQTWLTVAPASGTGSGDITLTAEENTAAQERTATVTISPTGTTTFTAIEVTVTQAAGGSTTTSDLLFPGSDFEDWNAFTGALNSYGLNTGAQSDNGRNGSKALYLSETPSRNGYVFTALVKDGFSTQGKTKIVFYIKGTTATKSLSCNVYIGPGNDYGVDYKCFNLGDYSAEQTLTPEEKNAYGGSINTNGEWVKVILDISSLTPNSATDQNLFALKVGKDGTYDLLIDDITVE